jgi:malonyl CoA-acyl carrier protein transacylase/4'-phosphopantetheinyl transferase EntD
MRLHDMDVGSESVFIGGQAMHALLDSLGVQADVMVGHSSGESSALVASRAIRADDTEGLAHVIRELNSIYRRMLVEGGITTGALLTVGALPKDFVEEQVAAFDDAFVAMENCNNQIIVFGDKATIEALQKPLTQAGGISSILPFDRGYHTPVFQQVSDAFLDFYEDIGLSVPQVPLYSCASADRFPADERSVRELAASQWSRKVRFQETIARMHGDGVRYFVEVGPSGNLTAFVNDILAGDEYLALPTNLPHRGGLEQLLTVLAHLYVNDRHLKLERLFASRSTQPVDLLAGWKHPAPRMPLDNTMPVLRLDEADRATLRSLLGTSEAAAHEVPPRPDAAGNSISHTPRHAAHEDAIGPSTSGAHTEDHVMTDYFRLMREFVSQQSSVLQQVAQTQVQEELEPCLEDYTPFLTSILEWDEAHLLAQCRLNVCEDVFLEHHVLTGPVSGDDPTLLGLSCVPLMVSLEVMAEACALLEGSVGLRVIEDVRAFDWIALDEGEALLHVRAEVLDPGQRRYRAELISDAGRVAVSADYCFEAEWHTAGLVDLSEKRNDFRFNDEKLYSTGMFHGPVFQSIRHVDAWCDEGIDASLSPVGLSGFFREGELPRMVVNPVLLDALGQLAACWIAQQVGTDFNCFPSTIDRIELYSDCPQNEPGLTLRARQVPSVPASNDMGTHRSWYFECLDAEGQPLFRTSNLVNVYFPVPGRFAEFRWDPLNGWLGRPLSLELRTGVSLWQLEHLPEDFCAQSSSIFLRTLAQALLGAEERVEWRELKASPSRQREWLLGRACIKEAVRWWLYEKSGQPVFPADVVVLHDEHGAPHVDGCWNGQLSPAPAISLSHDDRMSMVAVSDAGRPVGIDLERAGRLQKPELILEALTQKEQSLVRAVEDERLEETLLRIWCAKEAAAKYFGVGLEGDPLGFEVEFISDDHERARVTHDAREVAVSVHLHADSIVALASD